MVPSALGSKKHLLLENLSVKYQTDCLLWLWPHCACVDSPHTSSVYDPLPLVSAHWSCLRMAPAIIVYIWVLAQVNLYCEKYDTSFHIVLFMGHVLPFCEAAIQLAKQVRRDNARAYNFAHERACSKVWARLIARETTFTSLFSGCIYGGPTNFSSIAWLYNYYTSGGPGGRVHHIILLYLLW